MLELSDRIYVMKDGAVVAELATAEADVAKLHHWMVGRSLQAEYYREPLQRPYAPEVLVEVKGLSLGQSYRGVSFTLHKGEILGIAGVIGSGREELTRTLAGFAPHDGGTLTIGGGASAFRDAGRGGGRRHRLYPARAAGRGARAVPAGGGEHHAGRPREPHAARDHRHPARAGAGHEMGRAAEHPHARYQTLCLNLSGGNQQKVVLAKWLEAKARVLILDHPTRGLDVGAKEEVYELVRAVTAEGVGVILTSDTLEETIGLSHTVLVMRDGEITHRAEASPGAKPRQVDLIGHMV